MADPSRTRAGCAGGFFGMLDEDDEPAIVADAADDALVLGAWPGEGGARRPQAASASATPTPTPTELPRIRVRRIDGSFAAPQISWQALSTSHGAGEKSSRLREDPGAPAVDAPASLEVGV